MILLAQIHWLEAGVCFALGLFAGFLLWRWRQRMAGLSAERERSAALEAARREADTILREARAHGLEEADRLRKEVADETSRRLTELESRQSRLDEREQLINRQLSQLVEREDCLRTERRELEAERGRLAAAQGELTALERRRREELSRVAGLSEAEARQAFLAEIERECQHDAAEMVRRVLEEARGRAEEQARRIVGLAIQRYAGQHTFETTTATVALNGDEIKGRIIGREGRNIRSFESATGVTVLIDDTPGAVVLSGFDPVKREIARQAMELLVADGRIHPTRIEEVVEKVKQETEQTIERMGAEAVYRVGLPPLHPELVKLLGRLHFRYSYNQNILDHSVEVAQLVGIMASELGLDPMLARRAGLLHDIGKAVNHEVEGAHAAVGADIARRYGECEEVVNGVASHHDEVPHNGVLGLLVSAADAISASRPGARSESMDTYLKRLENLERIASSFEGVEKCYAVQAGREVRVLVQPDRVSDDEATMLARKIARRIEDELLYPGQIRVTIVREKRCVEFAK
ncbi:MAG: ribonuclease Y [Verrucomicrobia bacterium]|nr:ribonuclease Y [Verrucomicrobiota bacterium]